MKDWIRIIWLALQGYVAFVVFMLIAVSLTLAAQGWLKYMISLWA